MLFFHLPYLLLSSRHTYCYRFRVHGPFVLLLYTILPCFSTTSFSSVLSSSMPQARLEYVNRILVCGSSFHLWQTRTPVCRRWCRSCCCTVFAHTDRSGSRADTRIETCPRHPPHSRLRSYKGFRHTGSVSGNEYLRTYVHNSYIHAVCY